MGIENRALRGGNTIVSTATVIYDLEIDTATTTPLENAQKIR